VRPAKSCASAYFTWLLFADVIIVVLPLRALVASFSCSFPADPNVERVLTSLEATDQHGMQATSMFRLMGVFTPTTTATYSFVVSAGGAAQLYLYDDLNRPSLASIVASVPSPTGVRQWSLFASQRSRAMELTGGKAYYVEVQGKGPHVSVGVALARGIFNAQDNDASADEIQVCCCALRCWIARGSLMPVAVDACHRRSCACGSTACWRFKPSPSSIPGAGRSPSS
jgi:hypothetical protein